MQIPIDVPPEIQDQVIEKLQDNGVIPRLERKVQLGINIAIQELENQTKESVLMKRSTIKESKSEIEALNRIYKYLQSRELIYTYQCLKEEVAAYKKRSYTSFSIRK